MITIISLRFHLAPLLLLPPLLASPGKGGGQPAGERHRGDREQEPAAAHAHHTVPEPANAEHQPAHHVPEWRHRRRRQRRAGPLPRGRQEGRDGWVDG